MSENWIETIIALFAVLSVFGTGFLWGRAFTRQQLMNHELPNSEQETTMHHTASDA